MMLILNVSAAGLYPTAELPLFAGSTSKSMHDFRSCFMSHQERGSRPLWSILYDNGSLIANEGATGVSNPYRIRFTEGDRGNQVQVFISRRDRTEERHLLNAVQTCS